MVELTTEESNALSGFISNYINWIVRDIETPVRNILGLEPQELSDTFAKLVLLRSYLDSSSLDKITSDLLPIFKAAIIYARRSLAFDIEKRSGFTFNKDMRTKLEQQLRPFKDVMKQDWFRNTVSYKLKITDFISIQHAEALINRDQESMPSDRIYDEKFHILNAPALFLPDLRYYRNSCDLRARPLCVAYVDIDDFKQFNSKYGNPRVDRDVLPRFMSALEAHLYSHGYAYRYGGDEYVIILPNMSSYQSIDFLRGFQETIRTLEYFEIDKRIEVSIGLFEVHEDSHHTDREIEVLAASAKDYAKEKGKNCIATYKNTSFAHEDLYIVKK
jgi:diguanylate cyclase (GGDEF)-like protein